MAGEAGSSSPAGNGGAGAMGGAGAPSFGGGGDSAARGGRGGEVGDGSAGLAGLPAGGVAGANAVGGRSNGGASGAPLAGGAGSATDGAAQGGAGGQALGTPDVCSFQLETTLSTAIPTVGIVNWTTDLAGLSAARIEFSLADPTPTELATGGGGAIDITGTQHRALLLGLKAARPYTYRIVAKSGDTTCVSADQSLTTGAGTGAPSVTRTAKNPAAQARGFIITCGGYPYMDGGGPLMAYIIDVDGDVVWWADAPSECSRALMDWEGTTMWMVDTNPSGSSAETRPAGEVRSVNLDGTGSVTNVAGLANAHHDLTALPGGVIATLSWSDANSDSEILERAPDGTLTSVITLDDKVFQYPENTEPHANSLHYHSADDTYTVGDLYARTIVKVTRSGKLVWQLSESCDGARAPACATGTLAGNHGHHLLENGDLLLFQADPSQSTVREYGLSMGMGSLSAMQVWTYSAPALSSEVLGDVQRLPNENTLVDFCTDGQMQEVSPAGDVVQIIQANSPSGPTWTGAFGYANFRETLYGAPSD